MKTAEEILRKYYDCEGDRQDLQIELSLNCSFPLIEKIINEARKEAIEECAENAKLIYTPCGDTNTCGCQGMCERPFASVNKQSILKLIDQIK